MPIPDVWASRRVRQYVWAGRGGECRQANLDGVRLAAIGAASERASGLFEQGAHDKALIRGRFFDVVHDQNLD